MYGKQFKVIYHKALNHVVNLLVDTRHISLAIDAITDDLSEEVCDLHGNDEEKEEVIEQADDAPFELCLDGVGMLEKSDLPLAVVKSSLVQVLTHLDGHEVASLMVPALDHLTERAAPQLLQSLIPVG